MGGTQCTAYGDNGDNSFCPHLPFAHGIRYARDMADPRIIDIKLDEQTIIWRSADIEQERRIAIFDILEGNYFAPQRAHEDGYAGPYRLLLRVEEGRLVFEVRREDDAALESVILALGRFRRLIRDYFAICDSYYQAIKVATAQQIETVDMARRALHNEAAELLKERLTGKIEVDFDTARRLFTLICVLHIKG
ncbi:MAG: hypothetical protein RL764_1893 [Pseudomonadota bacterium]